MERVTCISGPRYTGKSYIAELLGRNLLSELRPDDHQVQNLIVYESSELNDQDSLKKYVLGCIPAPFAPFGLPPPPGSVLPLLNQVQSNDKKKQMIILLNT